MASFWINNEPRPANAEFEAFLELYLCLAAGKTANPVKLKLRIERTWDNLNDDIKALWTQWLAKENLFGPELTGFILSSPTCYFTKPVGK